METTFKSTSELVLILNKYTDFSHCTYDKQITYTHEGVTICVQDLQESKCFATLKAEQGNKSCMLKLYSGCTYNFRTIYDYFIETLKPVKNRKVTTELYKQFETLYTELIPRYRATKQWSNIDNCEAALNALKDKVWYKELDTVLQEALSIEEYLYTEEIESIIKKIIVLVFANTEPTDLRIIGLVNSDSQLKIIFDIVNYAPFDVVEAVLNTSSWLSKINLNKLEIWKQQLAVK